MENYTKRFEEFEDEKLRLTKTINYIKSTQKITQKFIYLKQMNNEFHSVSKKTSRGKFES
jgi:hypothetical protein